MGGGYSLIFFFTENPNRKLFFFWGDGYGGRGMGKGGGGARVSELFLL